MPAPAQTPVAFVKGTGMANFSEACQKLLLEAGYEPQWFGTYEHTRRQCDQARARVEDWEEMTPSQRAAQPERQPPASDYYLARCQSGHLSQDGTHRDSGTRENPCGNRYDGYDHDRAPCMPQQGASDVPGSEVDLACRHEAACATAVRDANRADSGLPAGSRVPESTLDRYPVGLRDAHERDRTQRVVDHNRPTGDPPPALQPGDRPRGMTQEDRARNQAQRDAADTAAGRRAPQRDAAAQSAAASSMPAGSQIEGDSAADCIDNFRKQGLQDMKSQAREERGRDQAANEEAAAHSAERAPALEAERDAAKRRHAHNHDVTNFTNRSAGQQDRQANRTEGEARTARAGADAVANDPNASPQARAAADQAARDAEAEAAWRRRQADARAQDRQAQRERDRQSENEVNRAQAAVDRNAQAPCLAAEGQRFNQGEPREEGPFARAPSYNRGDDTATRARADAAAMGISGRMD
jgi:hypothetical protein